MSLLPATADEQEPGRHGDDVGNRRRPLGQIELGEHLAGLPTAHQIRRRGLADLRQRSKDRFRGSVNVNQSVTPDRHVGRDGKGEGLVYTRQASELTYPSKRLFLQSRQGGLRTLTAGELAEELHQHWLRSEEH